MLWLDAMECYGFVSWAQVEGPACPVVGLKESGYIASWKGRASGCKRYLGPFWLPEDLGRQWGRCPHESTSRDDNSA